VLSYIRHREKVLVKPSLSDTLPESRFVNFRSAACNYNPIQIVFHDCFLNLILTGVSAGVFVHDHDSYIIQTAREFAYSVAVNGSGDVQSAFTDEYAYTKFVSQYSPPGGFFFNPRDESNLQITFIQPAEK
jgi:hypothetical protein